jgi:hypothetical protein
MECSIPEDVLAASPERLYVSVPTLRFEERAAVPAVEPLSDLNTAPPLPPASVWWRCGRRERTAREAVMSRKMEEMFVRAQRAIVHSTRVRGMASLSLGLLLTGFVKVRALRGATAAWLVTWGYK